MDISITINPDQVTSINTTGSTATIQIDLREIWSSMVNKYTDICIDTMVSIPTIEKQEDGTTIQTTTQTDITKSFKMDKITDKKIVFEIGYPGIFDTTRNPEGKATVLGYNTKVDPL